MSNDATCTIIGTLTRDWDLRFTNSGQAVATAGVAVNERVKGPDGQWSDGPASFYDITVWGELGQNITASTGKGDRVILSGRLKMDEWEDKETGAKRTKIKVTADAIGPELRFATANVAKVQRQDGGQQAAPVSRGGGGGPAPITDDPFGI